jgi:uncharacterized membrane protein
MYKKIIIVTIIFILLDAIYLTSTLSITKPLVENIQHSPIQLNYFSLIMVYIFDIFVLYYFIIYKNLSLVEAFLLGMCVYGVYEFTNKSILSKWTYSLAIMDTVWGGILFLLTTFFSRLFFKNKIF